MTELCSQLYDAPAFDCSAVSNTNTQERFKIPPPWLRVTARVFFQAEDGIRDTRDWSSDVCSSDLQQSCLGLCSTGPPAGGRERASTSVRARSLISRVFGHTILHRLLTGRPGGNAAGSGSERREPRRRRLDPPRGGLYLGLFRSFAGGQEEIPPGGGLGQAGSPQGGTRGDVGSRSCRAGGVFRECTRGKAVRRGGTRFLQGPGCGVWRCGGTGAGGGYGAVAGAGERSGKGLGGSLRPFQLPPHFARFWGVNPRRFPGPHQTAENPRPL